VAAIPSPTELPYATTKKWMLKKKEGEEEEKEMRKNFVVQSKRNQ
jgi:hypothetical protein